MSKIVNIWRAPKAIHITFESNERMLWKLGKIIIEFHPDSIYASFPPVHVLRKFTLDKLYDKIKLLIDKEEDLLRIQKILFDIL